MSTAQIRQRLHEIIDLAEDKKLKAIYTLLEHDEDDVYQLSAEQKLELDRRLADHQNNIGKTYSWAETTAMAEKAASKR